MHRIVNAENWIDELPEAVRSAMHDVMHAATFSPGDVVVDAGAPATAMFQVESGYLKLTGLQEDGRQVLVTIYGPGACFAETAVVAGRPMNHTTTAMTRARVCRLPAVDFWRLYREHPAIADALCRKFAAVISRQLAARESRAVDPLGARVASMFFELARSCGEQVPGGRVRIELPLTQTDIADFFDVTRQSIQREMTALKGAGVVWKLGGAWWVNRPASRTRD